MMKINIILMDFTSFFLCQMLLFGCITTKPYTGKRPEKCMPMKITLCKDIGYNLTYFPNLLKHGSPEEANSELDHFKPLIEINCYQELRLFLCGFYAPICVEHWQNRIPPCRSLCEKARELCSPFMKEYKYKWPSHFKCESLPEDDSQNTCLKKNNAPQGNFGRSRSSSNIGKLKESNENKESKINQQSMSNKYSTMNGASRHTTLNKLEKNKMDGTTIKDNRPDLINSRRQPLIPLKCVCICRPKITSTDSSYQLQHSNSGYVAPENINCLFSCHSPFFQNVDPSFPTFWLGIWASLCLASTTITMATFLIDRSRFQYPERPIIFLSFCYFFLSIGYMIRLVEGHEKLACSGNYVRFGSSGAVSCSMVFLLIYFFSSAAAIWWVILTITWFLAASMKWSSEAITAYADVFHFVAWFLPGLQSIIVLTLNSVDGDPVAGVCSVGNTSTINLLVFIIIPLSISLAVGAGFLLAGFAALLKIRRAIRESGHSKTDKLEKLMMRIGIFGCIYLAPGTIYIMCCLYEYFHRSRLERLITCPCQNSGRLNDVDYLHPEYSIFMMKYFMQLIVGTTSGFWVWTIKTVEAWTNLMRRSLCCCRWCCERRNSYSIQTLQGGMPNSQNHHHQQQPHLHHHHHHGNHNPHNRHNHHHHHQHHQPQQQFHHHNHHQTTGSRAAEGTLLPITTVTSVNSVPKSTDHTKSSRVPTDSLSTKGLLDSNHSSYNLNGRSLRSSLAMVRSSVDSEPPLPPPPPPPPAPPSPPPPPPLSGVSVTAVSGGAAQSQPQSALSTLIPLTHV